MLSRPLGLLILSVLLAHRWSMPEIAKFESFNMFQYLIYFAWLPAWALTFIRYANRESEVDQKSFLFSNLLIGAAGTLVLIFVFQLLLKSSVSWDSHDVRTNGEVGIILLSFFIVQFSIHRLFILGNIRIAYVYAFIQIITWIGVGALSNDFSRFIHNYVWIATGFIFFEIIQHAPSKIIPQLSYWKEIIIYAVYFALGAGISLLVSYSVQYKYGLGAELSMFRYGTRELPLLPALLSSFGLSFIPNRMMDRSEILNKVKLESKQIQKWIFAGLIFFMIVLPILFTPIFGSRFSGASWWLMAYTLIYIPRMIPSNILLQYLNDQKSMLWISTIEIVFTLACILICWNQISTIGFIWILIAGTLLERSLQVAILRIKHRIPIGNYISLKQYLVCSCMMIFVFILLWIGKN